MSTLIFKETVINEVLLFVCEFYFQNKNVKISYTSSSLVLKALRDLQGWESTLYVVVRHCHHF